MIIDDSKIYVAISIIIFTVATVAVPSTASVGEDGGTVRVCATLSVTGGGSTAIDIDIMLATSDGKSTVPPLNKLILHCMHQQNQALRW